MNERSEPVALPSKASDDLTIVTNWQQLLGLIDKVWNAATESEEVPHHEWASRLINDWMPEQPPAHETNSCAPESVKVAYEATPADQKEIIPLGCVKCSNVVLMPAANGVCDIRKAEGWVWSIVEGWRCPEHTQKAGEERS